MESTTENSSTKLLIVDDLPSNLLTLEYVLDDMEVDIYTAISAKNGLELMRKHDIAVALLDVQMPDMDGFEMASVIRNDEQLKHVPIIFVTAINRDSKYITRGYDIGGVDYLLKPIVPNVLRAKISVFIDLHKQRQQLEKSKEALARSEEEFRKLFEQSPLAIQIATKEGQAQKINKAWERLWGLTLEDIKNYIFMEDDYVKSIGLFEAISKAIGGASVDIPAMQFNPKASGIKKGKARWVKSRIYPVKDETGNTQNIVLLHEDITALKEAEAAQKKLDNQIQQMQRLESLGVLAGGLAHDFNNLMAIVISHSRALARHTNEDDPSQKNLTAINEAAQRAAELTGQMMDYAGKGQFHLKKVSLGAVIKEVIMLLDETISSRVTIEIDENILPINADSVQIRQVVSNLISNAAEAIDIQGKIYVRAGLADYCFSDLDNKLIGDNLDEGRHIFLEVEDDGVGMSPEVLDKIFEPFFTTKFTGRGLGLAAVHGIVRRHHAALKIVSEPGKGSRFQVLFPINNVET